MQETKTQVEFQILTKSPSRAQKILVAALATFLALGIAFFVGDNPPESPVTRAANSTLLVVRPTSMGTGVVVRRTNSQGQPRIFLWTAAHVAGGSDAVVRKIFRLGTQKAGFAEFPAILIAKGHPDLALYWIVCPADTMTGATFAATVAQPGEPVFHIGNFRGDNFDNSVTTGVISQVGVLPTDLPGWPWALVDQTDAVVVPGGSGGGVFNRSGEVVGLMVGTAGPGISIFVPTRVIFGWANSAGLRWAVYGDACPPDSALVSIAVDPVELPEVP